MISKPSDINLRTSRTRYSQVCNVIAHNLTRELQMRYRERDRHTSVKRPALWKFSKIGTLRKQIIQRAGRLIRPQSILTCQWRTTQSLKTLS